MTAQKDAGITLIDAHHHLWDLGHLQYPWLTHWDPDTFMGDYRPIMRNYLPEDYRRDSQGHRVLATVHCEADQNVNNEVAETRWLHDVARQHAMPDAVIAHVFFHHPRCAEILAEHCTYPMMRGIRCKPVTALCAQERHRVRGVPGSMQDPHWLAGYALLGKYQLSWDLRVPCWHLADAAEVARAFPGTPVVLNHLGFPWDRSPQGMAMWRDGMHALASCPNVSVKVSELGGPGLAWTLDNHRDVILETIAIFGIERCMFASNFPVAGLQISYHQLVLNMAEILADFSHTAREAFFWRNAQRVYRIPIAEPQ